MGPHRNRWLRLLRHRWFDDGDVRRALDAAALDRIAARVGASEAGHSGEIRISVEAALPLSYLWRRLSARDRALALFCRLRVWDTEHNNGVLIYLLLAEHAIEIVADRGLARRVAPEHWQALLAQMREALRAGHCEAALMQAVDSVGQALAAHFPLAPGSANPDELSNRVDLR